MIAIQTRMLPTPITPIMITIDTNDNLEVTPAAFQNMKHQVEDSLVRDIKGCR